MRIRTLTYFLAFIILALPNLNAREQPRAVRGVIDLRDYDFKTGGPVELKGDFEFYWKKMLNPAIEGDSGEMNYIHVPGSWYKLRKEVPDITRYGFATYRIKILVPEGTNELAFKIEDVFSASGYFLNGKAFEYLGFPGVNKFQTVINYNLPLITVPVNKTELELIIRVSNFDNRASGITGGITLGMPEQMQNERQKELF